MHLLSEAIFGCGKTCLQATMFFALELTWILEMVCPLLFGLILRFFWHPIFFAPLPTFYPPSITKVTDLIYFLTLESMTDTSAPWWSPCPYYLGHSGCSTWYSWFLGWHFTSNGQYTVRPSYRLLMNRTFDFDRSLNLSSHIWKNIWTAQITPKLCLFFFYSVFIGLYLYLPICFTDI